MRISAKSRYGISSLIYIAYNSKAKEYITLQTLSSHLQISRIYLEQVFVLLKRANLVLSAKGLRGGYQLSRKPDLISVYDILMATESSLFEKTSSQNIAPDRFIDLTVAHFLLEKVDAAFEKMLKEITLENLIADLEKQISQSGFMYQI
ncbi:MAG: Rrf2 family transcriptional regulator [Elusimicrobiota bacterium]|jgi:Rrf2 family protein|nr:Rrf2 family transcriptional regulator [Elusimicrobiota bacterium]